MRRFGLGALAALALASGAAAAPADLPKLKREAARVSIVRDDWGVAHVTGKTDADAVFGAIYAQAEDDFNRVETNYLTALGRTAEAEGEAAIWADLRQKLYFTPEFLKAEYARSPTWLKALMSAWADGLNYYLATHPGTKPKVITRFEPWMALSFSEGSIGGDIERIPLKGLEAFYGQRTVAEAGPELTYREPTGSNGFAIAPSNTRDGHALLLINPHTSFFFRSELQMTSGEGLNAYGATTWGQFFLYQGFNQHAGWMHTSSGVDVVDEFLETIVDKGGKLFYRYGAEERPVTVETVAVAYKLPAGGTATRRFTVYKTHHGPIIREQGGKWVAFAMMNKPVEALSQSFLRTKTSDLASFMKVAELKANSSNNIIFADDKGEIAYLHPQFIPARDDRFDYTKPVDGSDPTTDWKPLLGLDQAPRVVSPPNGWIFNTNDWPYSAAGPYSPKRAEFPRYMDMAGENARGVHATRVLDGRKDFTVESLLKAAYDPYLPAFAELIPSLLSAYDKAPGADPLKAKLKGPADLLRGWDYRWSAASEPTALAVFWGDALYAAMAPKAAAAASPTYDYMVQHSTPAEKLAALDAAVDRLTQDFGSWKTPWGEINRFQRLTADIVQPFDDAGASSPVPFTSSLWGSLASFGARRYPGTKRYYGTSGNSFVALVEFGPKVRAVAVSAGGESGDPASKHFKDQVDRYAAGDLRAVYFYPEQLKGHTERSYRPGE